MEQSKALQGLMEAADLVRMVEDLTNPTVLSSLSAASLSGVKITLKNIREAILESHDTLATHVIHRARVHLDTSAMAGAHSLNEDLTRVDEEKSLPVCAQATPAEKVSTSRRDLRMSLEKIIER